MTDSAMNVLPVLKEVEFLKKELEFKHSIGTLRAETLELKYERLASDCKAMEEVVEDCFLKCRKNIDKELFTTTITSIYEEIATLAKYQRDTRTNFEGRLVEQEKRHGEEMQRLENMLFEQAKKHTEDMNSLVMRLEKMHGKVEISSDESEESDYESDGDIFVLSDRDLKQECPELYLQSETKLPIAQSLTEMLYQDNFPTL